MTKETIFEDEILTVKEIMNLLKISRAYAYRLMKSKQFPVMTIGSSLRVPRKPFIDWAISTLNVDLY